MWRPWRHKSAPAADLAVTISGSASAADTINDFTYLVTVTNNGPSVASDVALVDTLPVGMTVVSLSSSQNGNPTQNGGIVSLAIDSLNPGESLTMSIVVAPTAAPGSVLIDSASVGGQQADPNPGNNTATLDTPVVGVSDLGIVASAPPGPIYVGQTVMYALTVSNQGPDAEPDAVVSFPASSAVAFVSANDLAGGTVLVSNGLVTDALGPLAAGASETVNVVLTPQAVAAGTLSMSFSVQGQNVDPVTSNNTSDASVTVVPAADLAVAITTPGTAPAVQADWTYTLTVSNLGLSAATGVTLVSPLPPNVQVMSVTTSQGSVVEQNGTLSADLGTLSAGKSAIMTIIVMPTTIGPLPMSASVSGDQYDLDLRTIRRPSRQPSLHR